MWYCIYDSVNLRPCGSHATNTRQESGIWGALLTRLGDLRSRLCLLNTGRANNPDTQEGFPVFSTDLCRVAMSELRWLQCRGRAVVSPGQSDMWEVWASAQQTKL